MFFINIDKTIIVFLSLLVGFAAGVVVPLEIGVIEGYKSGEDVAQTVLETYQKSNPSAELDILSVDEINDLYRIRLSTGGAEGTYQTVYATKDGNKISQEVLDLGEINTLIDNRIDFLDCLRQNDVRIFGAIEAEDPEVAQASILQIQILGGTEYLDNVYVDCSGRKEECAEEGISNLPSLVYQGEIFHGVTQYEWFEENVGCTI